MHAQAQKEREREKDGDKKGRGLISSSTHTLIFTLLSLLSTLVSCLALSLPPSLPPSPPFLPPLYCMVTPSSGVVYETASLEAQLCLNTESVRGRQMYHMDAVLPSGCFYDLSAFTKNGAFLKRIHFRTVTQFSRSSI